MPSTDAANLFDRTLISAIDLFCGAGGLTRGFLDEGIPVTLGIDLDPHCHWPYERNNPGARFMRADIASISGTDLTPSWGEAKIRVLAGCAPCQPFSTYARSRKSSDDRWSLLGHFKRLVEETLPDIVTMENVPQLVDHKVFAEFCSRLAEIGYVGTAHIVDCAKYGVPQTRKRLVSFFSFKGEVHLPSPTHGPSSYETVRQTISGTRKLSAGETDPEDVLHRACKLSELNLQRIRASKPGGTWRDWPEALIAPCHRRKSGATYPSVYGRMEWDAPSPTMTTQCFGFGNGRFGHPEQDRAITLREAALLQTFPPKYEFLPEGAPLVFDSIGRLIGNAVPVRLGGIVAQSILNHIGLRPF